MTKEKKSFKITICTMTVINFIILIISIATLIIGIVKCDWVVILLSALGIYMAASALVGTILAIATYKQKYKKNVLKKLCQITYGTKDRVFKSFTLTLLITIFTILFTISALFL